MVRSLTVLFNHGFRYAWHFQQSGSNPFVLDVERSQRTMLCTTQSGPEPAQFGTVVTVPRPSHPISTSGMYRPCPPLTLFFPNERYTSSSSFHSSVLAASTTEELSTDEWAPFFSMELSRSDIVSTLFSSLVFVKLSIQAVWAIASTRKRTARDSIIQALSHWHFLSLYRPVKPQDYDNKRQEIQAAKEYILDITTDSTYDQSWYNWAPFLSITLIPTRLSLFLYRPYTDSSQLFGSSRDFALWKRNYASFRHSTDPTL